MGTEMSYPQPTIELQENRLPRRKVARVTTQANPNPGVEVTRATPEEWRASIKRALERLNLSRQQLEDQARQQDFSSTEARKLWLAIVDQR